MPEIVRTCIETIRALFNPNYHTELLVPSISMTSMCFANVAMAATAAQAILIPILVAQETPLLCTESEQPGKAFEVAVETCKISKATYPVRALYRGRLTRYVENRGEDGPLKVRKPHWMTANPQLYAPSSDAHVATSFQIASAITRIRGSRFVWAALCHRTYSL